MKLLMKFLFIVLAALAGLVLARNVIIKAAVENGVRAVTGMPLSIGKFDLSLFKSSVEIENLVVKNPKGFHGTSLVEIPKILAACDLPAALKSKVHLTDLEFEVQQFTVVKNEKGELNLDRLKALQSGKKAPAGAPEKEPAKPAQAPSLRIDHVRLKIGKVVYADYSSGKPVTQEFLIDLDESYQDITDLNKLVSLIVFKVMTNSAIANLVNFNVRALEGGLLNVLSTGKGTAGKVAAQGLEVLMNAAQNPGQATGSAEATLQNTLGVFGNAGKSTAGSVTNAANVLRKKIKIQF